MKKLTEIDINRIVKKVLNENDLYFRRRGVNLETDFLSIIEKTNFCKYKKLTTYFNNIFDSFLLKMYVNNEFIRSELQKDSGTKNKIREMIIEQYSDFMVYYYKLKCGTAPKY
jgi:hypothetical protein